MVVCEDQGQVTDWLNALSHALETEPVSDLPQHLVPTVIVTFARDHTQGLRDGLSGSGPMSKRKSRLKYGITSAINDMHKKMFRPIARLKSNIKVAQRGAEIIKLQAEGEWSVLSA